MLEATLGLDTMVSILLAVLWIAAGYMAAGLANPTVYKKLRFRAKMTSHLVLAGTVVLAIKTATTGMYGAIGWTFVWDKWLVALPVIGVPGLIALIVSWPRLRKLASLHPYATDSVVEIERLRKAASSWLVVPIQSAGAGALISLYFVFFPLTVSYFIPALTAWVLLLAAIALFAFMQSGRQTQIGGGEKPSRNGWNGPHLRAAVISVMFVGVIIAWSVVSYRSSLLPDSYSMGDHHAVDYGGGAVIAHAASGHHGTSGNAEGTVSVSDLTGPRTGEADRKFTLTAAKTELRLASGQTVEAWLYNGKAPGPELRVRQGELVEVTLKNEMPKESVTIHWHGVNVPNAEDGVAGVTQNAVEPGESYTYRFVAEDAGTYWYHSHQQSSIQAKKGLFGALIVEPAVPETPIKEMTVLSHTWFGDQEVSTTLGLSDRMEKEAVDPGTRVKLRLINTTDILQTYMLMGVPFKVTAIDGVDLNEPDTLSDSRLKLAAGGRYVVEYTMPETPVTLILDDYRDKDNPGILFSRDGQGQGTFVNAEDLPVFDPLSYGKPAPTPINANSEFDREFSLYFDSIPGFYDGRFMYLWAINGKVFPHTPTLMVKEEERVKMTFINRSYTDHPMHLHGHHMLVLSRNGKQVTGSPWWTDTLNVAPGEAIEVGFIADNPGLWMDHCHNTDHAAIGMTMHLSYEGVTTPFLAGRASGNTPE